MRDRTDRDRLRRFLGAFGRRLRRPVRLYLVGGSVMIDLWLRSSALEVDHVATADDPAALGELDVAIRQLKNELRINVEPASPADFLPIPSWALERSRYVGQQGSVSIYHYHLPSQVIAKAARGLEQDLDDAERLVRADVVAWEDIDSTWREVKASPTGWLRYEPDEVEARLETLRRRLDASP